MSNTDQPECKEEEKTYEVPLDIRKRARVISNRVEAGHPSHAKVTEVRRILAGCQSEIEEFLTHCNPNTYNVGQVIAALDKITDAKDKLANAFYIPTIKVPTTVNV